MADLDGQRFLEKILRFYGENKTISTENLEDLLLLISARRSQSITEENPLEEVEVSVRTDYISCNFACQWSFAKSQ